MILATRFDLIWTKLVYTPWSMTCMYVVPWPSIVGSVHIGATVRREVFSGVPKAIRTTRPSTEISTTYIRRPTVSPRGDRISWEK